MKGCRGFSRPTSPNRLPASRRGNQPAHLAPAFVERIGTSRRRQVEQRRQRWLIQGFDVMTAIQLK